MGVAPARLTLVGVGAMNSPRYRPAGLLVSTPDGGAVLLDGGGEVPAEPLVGWLVTDRQCELIAQIRRLARPLGLRPQVIPLVLDGVAITPWPVQHTSHPTFGYLIDSAGRRAGWAPEFVAFPYVGGGRGSAVRRCRGLAAADPLRAGGGRAHGRVDRRR